MAKPIAVLISDVHYNLSTLDLADKATNMAIDKANQLKVPLIVAGDLHDTKANLRGECVNKMLTTFSKSQDCMILRGNHDQINEKSSEHSLNFLGHLPKVLIIDNVFIFKDINLIPYQHDPKQFESILNSIPKGALIIMHQGVVGAGMGDYMQDHSAIDISLLSDYRVISGHYHTRQTIKTGRPRKGAIGALDYIGNPYTLTFGEASDPEKGFQILMDDGTLEFVPTNLRRHIKLEMDTNSTIVDIIPAPTDLVWIKLEGTKEELLKFNKKDYCIKMGLPDNTKIELIPVDTKNESKVIKSTSQTDTLDAIIDTLINTTREQKYRLKQLWRTL